jgi:nitroimidazol reductase NimA-like FMN-containing flavoprotein (pyridoxamine 5'-phosphate oxidase superfamily)
MGRRSKSIPATIGDSPERRIGGTPEQSPAVARKDEGVIQDLDRTEIEAFLRRQVVGRIGCHAGGRTYVVPVIYVWDGECVYVQSIEGRKIEMMRANPEVCFEVDEYRPGGSWRSVIVEGAYEELDDNAHALALLVQRFGGFRSAREPRSASKPVAFRIRARTLTGRCVLRAPAERAAVRAGVALLRRRARAQHP